MKILITGAAGFIGYHTVLKILSKKKNLQIVGIDSLNSYYSKKLKLARIKNLKKNLKKNFFLRKLISQIKKKYRLYLKDQNFIQL